MGDTCGDNRFELIEKYKQKLLDATNIEDSPEEMAVIDNILFRFWQMGWLDKDTNVTTADCISRQAAISEIMEDIKDRSLHDDPATPEDFAEGYDEGIRNAAAIVLRVPPAQTDLITKILNGIKATDADDVYSCGMRNGMRWCISLIDDKEPLYENCSSAQPEPIAIRVDHELSKEEYERLKRNMQEQPVIILPKESAQPGWIPVTERLPENNNDVLVTDGTDCAVAYWRTDAQAWDDCMHGWCDLYGLEVKAWMPLPKPWEGDANG